MDDLPLGNLMRAVVGFEQSRTPADLARVAQALRGWLRSEEDSDLGRAFAAWVQEMVVRIGPEQAEVELGETLEEATMTLVERVAQWPEQWRREGRREGVAEGRREGVAEGRREGVAEGRREGVAEGRREGVDRQRALLGRVAGGRFGEAVGERVEALLGDTEDWGRLSAAAELIAAAPGEAELVDGVARVVRRSD